MIPTHVEASVLLYRPLLHRSTDCINWHCSSVMINYQMLALIPCQNKRNINLKGQHNTKKMHDEQQNKNADIKAMY